MLQIFVFAPFYLSGRKYSDLDVFGLKRENYKRKLLQRIILLIVGTIFWIGLMIAAYKSSEKTRLEEIEKVDISDWKEFYYGTDSLN